MTGHVFSIGVASARSGVKVQTIRYYQAIGLLREPQRTNSNRRLYDAAGLRRLIFIRHARELGFGIKEIRVLLLLQDNPDQSCIEADVIVRERLVQLQKRIELLCEMKAELERMISGCPQESVAKCQIFGMLATGRHS